MAAIFTFHEGKAVGQKIKMSKMFIESSFNQDYPIEV